MMVDYREETHCQTGRQRQRLYPVNPVHPVKNTQQTTRKDQGRCTGPTGPQRGCIAVSAEGGSIVNSQA